jgi:hypothetical protein
MYATLVGTLAAPLKHVKNAFMIVILAQMALHVRLATQQFIFAQ